MELLPKFSSLKNRMPQTSHSQPILSQNQKETNILIKKVILSSSMISKDQDQKLINLEPIEWSIHYAQNIYFLAALK